MLSTELAPAKEPTNNDNSPGIFNFKHNDIIESIVSPAPTLSITFYVKAGHCIILFFSLPISKAPFLPLVTIKLLILYFFLRSLESV